MVLYRILHVKVIIIVIGFKGPIIGTINTYIDYLINALVFDWTFVFYTEKKIHFIQTQHNL